MSERGRQFGALFLALIAGVVIKAAFSPGSTSKPMNSDVEQVAEKVRSTLSSLQGDAKTHYPGLSEADAIQREALTQAEASLRNSPETKRKFVAASQFLGFYYANTRAYSEICLVEGVDVSPYVKLFEEEHVSILRRAGEVMATSGTTTAQVNDAIDIDIAQGKPFLTKNLLEFAANNHGQSIGDGCRYLAAHGVTLAGNNFISNVNPSIYQTLMAKTPAVSSNMW